MEFGGRNASPRLHGCSSSVPALAPWLFCLSCACSRSVPALAPYLLSLCADSRSVPTLALCALALCCACSRSVPALAPCLLSLCLLWLCACVAVAGVDGRRGAAAPIVWFRSPVRPGSDRTAQAFNSADGRALTPTEEQPHTRD